MNKFTFGLLLFWLTVLTVFGCYVIKAEHAFLKFADFVLDDNLKNVVQSGGATFYVVDMGIVPVPGVDKSLKFWSPIYVNANDLGKLIDWKRNQTLMVKEFQNMDFESKMAALRADKYFQQRLSDLRKRKPDSKK